MKSSKYYILVGDEKTWETSFSENIWGFSDKTKGFWNTMNEGDFLAFYVTSPIKKIIGYGHVEKKFISKKLFWPDEKLFKRPLWTYRLKFNPSFILQKWDDGISSPKGIMLNHGRKTISQEMFLNLIKISDQKWETNLGKKISF